MNKYKFSFIDKDGNGGRYYLQHDVDGWKNFGVSFGRMDGASNTMKKYTESWVFIGEDGEYLKRHFFRYGVNGKVQFIVEEKINQIRDDYKVIFLGWVDFSFIQFNTTVSVPVKSGGFYSAMENKNSKEYEFEMDCKIENFTGLKMNESCLYKSDHYQEVGRPPQSMAHYLALVGLQYKNKEKEPGLFKGIQWEFIDGVQKPITYEKCFFCLQGGSTSSIDNLKVSWDIDLYTTISNSSISKYKYRVRLIEYQYNEHLSFAYNNFVRSWDLYTGDLHEQGQYGGNYPMRLKTSGNIVINNGCSGKMYVIVIDLYLGQYSLELSSVTRFNISSFSIAASSDYTMNINKNLQAIKSIDVFKKLIEKINNNRYRVRINDEILKRTIDNTNTKLTALLTNGAGLRGYPVQLTEQEKRILKMVGIKYNNEYEFSPAKFITTLSNYLKYIHIVHGLKFDVTYNIETDTYTVGFTTFEQSLNDNVITRLTETNKVNFEPATEFSYTNIKAGYTPKEDSLFGKSEYNNTMEFKTMYDNIDESVLDLVSPYSGSVFDIETFLYNNYQKFKDAENRDTENYIIVCEPKNSIDNNIYKLRRQRTVDGNLPFPATAWNTDITPRTILNNHRLFLNSVFAFHKGKQMTFSLSKRNAGIIVDGISENGAVTIGNDRKFIPLLVTFNAPATSDLLSAIDRNKNGLIEFVYNGKLYSGWLWGQDAVTVNPMNEKESNFKLIVNKYE